VSAKERSRRNGPKSAQPEFSLAMKVGEEAVLDHIDALLLHNIASESSITRAAKTVGISYRNAWDRLSKLQRDVGERIVIGRAGGSEGGGAQLTPEGKRILAEYRRLNNYLFSALGDKDFWLHAGYRLSARNRLKAKIVSIDEGPITSELKMQVTTKGSLTSIISNEAVEELGLKEGDEVDAIIKATEVIVAKLEDKVRLAGKKRAHPGTEATGFTVK
jgi:molybdate transport system regulatory protein